jgi:hypothetical protein
MRLRYRPAMAGDLRDYVRHLTVRERYGSLFDRLADVWCALLRRESIISAVVEDLERNDRDRALALGVSVFVTDEFLRRVKTPPLFWIGPELIRHILQNNSPILDSAAIRRANSGEGLNSFVWEADIRSTEKTEFLAVATKLGQAFVELHAGFMIKEAIAQHPCGRMFRLAVQFGGWFLQSPSGEYVQLRHPEAEESVHGPFVLGLTRELAREHPGSWLSTIFDYRSPRCFFTRAEQRLLNSALSGRTDEEIADVLAVSLSAVKKCWQSAYARVSLGIPELLPADSCDLLCGSGRGAEKRRRLLAYLQSHPEELRPALPQFETARMVRGTRRSKLGIKTSSLRMGAPSRI